VLLNAQRFIYKPLSRHFGENTDFKIQGKGCVFWVLGINQISRNEYGKVSFLFGVFYLVKTLKNRSIFASL